ncbi:MAG TPA: alpha/beta hydrolase, partial [Chroococcidiopsis sp.]
SGLLGLLYARHAPHRVKSLTLLSVGADPAVDWQAHYYTQAQLLPCSRDILLAQMVHTLWGWQSPPTRQALIKRLDRDLLTALSPHTLLRQASIPPEGAPVPLLVCAGGEDLVISPSLFDGWQPHLKPGDRQWLCPQGRYFFHQAHAEQTAQRIQAFWHSLPDCSVPSSLSRTSV